ncbi:MAG: YHS domain-containing protein [Polyangiaceae bacterium]|nr:YHS domain-containing protein [Polyangiaceae bacterium]
MSKEEFVVNADSPKVEYEGKTYYFCCSGCDKAFQKDPKKYLSK